MPFSSPCCACRDHIHHFTTIKVAAVLSRPLLPLGEPREVLTELPTEQQTGKWKIKLLDPRKNATVTHSLESSGKFTCHQFWSCWRYALCAIPAHNFFCIHWSLCQRVRTSINSTFHITPLSLSSFRRFVFYLPSAMTFSSICFLHSITSLI